MRVIQVTEVTKGFDLRPHMKQADPAYVFQEAPKLFLSE